MHALWWQRKRRWESGLVWWVWQRHKGQCRGRACAQRGKGGWHPGKNQRQKKNPNAKRERVRMKNRMVNHRAQRRVRRCRPIRPTALLRIHQLSARTNPRHLLQNNRRSPAGSAVVRTALVAQAGSQRPRVNHQNAANDEFCRNSARASRQRTGRNAGRQE